MQYTFFAYIRPFFFFRGLGAAIAEKFAAEGSNVAINFVNREEPAIGLAERLKRDYDVKTTVIQGVGIYKRVKRAKASDNEIWLFRIAVFSPTASIAFMRRSKHLEDLTL